MDRIEKLRKVDTWKVDAAKQTKEDKNRNGSQAGQESRDRDSFEETSDFTQLLSKDPRKFISEKIPSTQISGFVFRGISTHRDRALLEVDIALADGSLIKGAQIALSRQEGMRYLSRPPGEEIVVDQLVKGTFLTIARPERDLEEARPQRQSGETIAPPPPVGQMPRVAAMTWNYVLGFGAMGIAILLLIYFLAL
ncbi:MAG TPA: hypothetical protein DF383_12550 [Deltaproteobacteria bacterium]|nr:hypothetical protein [Deltaproteobacteria bacterium]